MAGISMSPGNTTKTNAIWNKKINLSTYLFAWSSTLSRQETGVIHAGFMSEKGFQHMEIISKISFTHKNVSL